MSDTALTRRTFIGSLFAAVPALGTVAALARLDPVVNECKITSAISEFVCRIRASGVQDVSVNGHPMTLDRFGDWQFRDGQESGASIRCKWHDDGSFWIDYFRFWAPREMAVGRDIVAIG